MPVSARVTQIASAVVFVMLMGGPALRAAEPEFPYDRELLLDVAPKPGSKRVPSLEVSGTGGAVIDLWCAKARGQFVFAGDTLTIIIGPLEGESCTPESEKEDADLATALTQVTNWRRQGSTVVLVGAKDLRFQLQTN